MVTIARTTADVDMLLRGILDPHRVRPIAVVTTLFASGEPLIDVAKLERSVDGVADIALVESGDLTHQLVNGLPPDCTTFNGAVRSFPTGGEWMLRPSLARRRFSFSPTDGETVLQSVIEDLLGMAYRAGLTVASAISALHASGVVHGMVADNTRALVQLDNGGMATISAETTFAPAPLDWVIGDGGRVHGMLDPDTRRLLLDDTFANAATLWAHYPVGSVTLALVHSVERQRAVLLVHPSHPVTVSRDDLSTNPLDRVDLLLTEGDVIEVRVVRDPHGRPALRTIDLDDDETVLSAVTLTTDGQPWLRVGRALPQANTELTVTSIEQFLETVGLARDATDTAAPLDTAPLLEAGSATEPACVELVGVERANVSPTTRPGPGPGLRPALATELSAHAATSAPAANATAPDPTAPTGTAPTASERRTALQSALATIDLLQGQLRTERARQRGPGDAALRAEVDQLTSLAKELVADKKRAVEDARTQRERLTSAQASLRSARRIAESTAPDSPRDRRDRFATPEEWIRHELYVQWIARFDASSRVQHPLPMSVRMGPQFAASLDPLDATQLDKALRCAMEAATGFISKMSAREVHSLRHGGGGDDAPVVRPSDGARCQRAYIEQKTPQARRLHYWSLRGGGVELSRVVTHDDVEP